MNRKALKKKYAHILEELIDTGCNYTLREVRIDWEDEIVRGIEYECGGERILLTFDSMEERDEMFDLMWETANESKGKNKLTRRDEDES